jgi:sortase A
MADNDDPPGPEPAAIEVRPETDPSPAGPRREPVSLRSLGWFGRTFITGGVLVLLFVAYQLWGTSIYEANAQHKLRNEFSSIEQAAKSAATSTSSSSTATSSSTTAAPDSTVPATTAPSTTRPANTDPSQPPKTGGAIAHLVISKIGLDKIVVQGVSVDDLKRSPGHYPSTVFPGQLGNAGIAGHRTTYGAPFNRLDELQNGDEIKVTTLQGSFTYVVDSKREVDPTEISVLNDTPNEARLTLTTCTPKYSAAKRLIIGAKLVDKPVVPIVATAAVPAGGATTTIPGADTTLPGADTTTITVAAATSPASFEGSSTNVEQRNVWKALLFGWHIIWALACAGVWIGAWALGKAWRKWPAYFIGAPVFLLLLFFYFEGIASRLPPGV